MQLFAKHLEHIVDTMAVPEEAYKTIWENLILHVAHIFVEG